MNIYHLLNGREYYQIKKTNFLCDYYVLNLKEKKISNTLSKIFTSTWISDRKIMFGTKDHQVYIIDSWDKKITLFKNHLRNDKRENDKNFLMYTTGIKSMKSLDDIICYASEKRIYIIYDGIVNSIEIDNAHEKWISSLEWINEKQLISAGSDNIIKLWSIDEDNYKLRTKKKLGPKSFPRDIKYNNEKISILYKNGNIEQFDINTENKIWDSLGKWEESIVLNNDMNNLILHGYNDGVILYDNRIKKKVCIENMTKCVRSLEWCNNNTISIGSNKEKLIFWDIRKRQTLYEIKIGKNLPSNNNNVLLNDFPQLGDGSVFTHSYSRHGKIFVGGGPTAVGIDGNIMSLIELKN